MKKIFKKIVIPAQAGILSYPTRLCLLGMTIFTLSLSAQAETAITIYSKAQAGAISPEQYRPVAGQPAYYQNQSVPGYAMVRDVREVDLPGKKTILKFQDVAAQIDPTTVQFRSLTDPSGTKVVEQNFQFDLVSRDKLMQKFIDKQVTVERKIGDKLEEISGTLLSVDGGLTLKMADGSIRTTNDYGDVKFPDLPGGLITKPTLVWEIYTQKIGKHKAEVAYQTDGITWWADYNLTYREGKNANAGMVDFGSWVSIINQSGASYNDAKLKLMAGDVQRVQPQNATYDSAPRQLKMEMAESAPAFVEKAFFEYHLYTLNRPATLPQNSTKQLELIPAAKDVPVEKIYVFENGSPWYGYANYDQSFGAQAGAKIGVYLKLENIEKNGLGVPLPAGRVRVNQRDDDGSLEFIGEDIIEHIAAKEDVLIKLGNAFDVVGERKQIDYQADSTRQFVEEEYEIKLRNRKKQAVEIVVQENLGRGNSWEVLSSSQKWTKENSNKIQFKISLKPDAEQVVKYRVKYSW
jgi:hypothetical protein